MSEENSNGSRLNFSFDYILIIEYLDKDEPRTGLALYENLREFAPESVLYFSCSTKTEVLSCIDEARLKIKTRGIPAVHIESHGSGWDKELKTAAIGYPGGEPIHLSEIYPYLIKLNEESKFNLMLVGACCYGAEYLRGIAQLSGDKLDALPFFMTVGFDDEVSAQSVYDFFFNFYIGILIQKHPVFHSLELAQAKIKELVQVKYSILVLEKIFNGLDYEKEIALMLENFNKSGSRIIERAEAFDLLIKSIETIISDIFAYDKFPENKEKFKFSIPKLKSDYF